MLKKCNKCLEDKDISCFSKDKNRKDGYYSICKECKKEYRLSHLELLKIGRDKYYQNNKHSVLQKSKDFYLKNKEEILERSKEFYLSNRENKLEQSKLYYKKNREYLLNKSKKYVIENYGKVLEYQKKYKQDKFKKDPIFRIIICMRARVNNFLKEKNITKKNKTFDIVGCSPEFLKEHLEKQFINGMSWDNRDEWHIDHIIPLSSATIENEVYKLCHYSNLQPLWAFDNLSKGNKIIEIK
jgi:hypothetical protein